MTSRTEYVCRYAGRTVRTPSARFAEVMSEDGWRVRAVTWGRG